MVDPNQYHIAAVSDLNGYIFSSQTADCHVIAAGQDRKYAIVLPFHLRFSTSTDVAATEMIFEFHSTLLRKFQVFTFFSPFFSSFSNTRCVFPTFIPETSAHSLWLYRFNWNSFSWTFFETPVRDTHSHTIDFLTCSQELMVIAVFFGKENERIVWQCWCSSWLQQNDVTHSWAIEKCKAAALAVCKQTWVCGGISGWKHCIFLSKVQCVNFLWTPARPNVSYLAHCQAGVHKKNGSARWQLTGSVIALLELKLWFINF